MEVDLPQGEGEHDPLQAQVGRAYMNRDGPNVRDQLYDPLNLRRGKMQWLNGAEVPCLTSLT